jgi:hypothetical protein
MLPPFLLAMLQALKPNDVTKKEREILAHNTTKKE